MSPIDSLPPLREVVRRHGLVPKKSLGQNFLFDLNLTSRVARAAGPLEDVAVVEIGPGPGGLTRALLAAGAREVVAIERDPRCLPALAEIAEHYPGRLRIVAADAAGFDPRPLLGAAPARIVANLPYNVGTALLTGWLAAEEWPPWWRSLTLMFQREVAERIVADERDRGKLRPPRRARRLAHAGPHPLRRAARSLRAAAEGDLERRPADAAAGSPALPGQGARGRHPRRLRAAPQDAAPEPASR